MGIGTTGPTTPLQVEGSIVSRATTPLLGLYTDGAIGSQDGWDLQSGTTLTIREIVAGSSTAQLTFAAGGNMTTNADLEIGGGDLTTDETTFNLINTTATTLNIGGAASTYNMAGGSGSTGCTIDGSGNLTCSGTVSGGGGAAFLQDGNSFATTAVLGTNDANSLSFETNTVVRMTIDSAGRAGIGTSTPSSFGGAEEASLVILRDADYE